MCVDERLRLSFPEHDCQSARFAGLTGLKNGQLLDCAEAAGFNVLLTVDQNIPNQQNVRGRRLSILILSAPTNRLRDLLPLVPAVKEVLGTIGSGAVLTIAPRLACDKRPSSFRLARVYILRYNILQCRTSN
jgi:hypothetical protein